MSFRNYLRHISVFAFYFTAGLSALPAIITAQNKSSADSVVSLNLDQCIAYGLENQPGVLQSNINIAIVKKTNQINLSGWLPQVNLNGTLTHYDELPTSYVTNAAGEAVPTQTGIFNTANAQLAATETIFSPGLLYNAQSAHLLVQQAKQSSDSSKIGIVSSVSTAFYSLLNTVEEINVLKEDTARLGKNLKDAYHQYIGGIVDKTDYEEALISLNNTKASLRQYNENLRPQYASLKQVMGLPPEKNFNVNFDTAQMMHEIAFDTVQPLKYENRIEYQLLETEKSLQLQTLNYYRYNFLPTLSGFYTYNDEFANNSFSNLFNQSYPYSFIGASISIPLFTGFSRLENIQKVKLQRQITDLSEVNLKSVIYTQYTAALANYKSNLYNLNLQRVNMSMSKDVYNVVTLQYRQGIVPYLNVITAEDNLISSETSYINALFQLLLDKVELEKALGNIAPSKH